MFFGTRKPSPPELVVIDTKTSVLQRFVGRRLTHKSQIVGGVSAANLIDIMHFRKYPDHNAQYIPEPA